VPLNGGLLVGSDHEANITEDDVRDLAQIAGVYDSDVISALHDWMVRETPALKRLPDLVDQLQGDEDAARLELQPLNEVAQALVDVIRDAPHALERVRMLYAEELQDILPFNLGDATQRRLDQDLKGMGRFLAAVVAANEHIQSEEQHGPALLGPRKAAEQLVEQYEKISYQQFSYDVPNVDTVKNPWNHPHTSAGTRFVAKALKVIFPNLNDTNLKRILQELPQFTNGRRHSKTA